MPDASPCTAPWVMTLEIAQALTIPHLIYQESIVQSLETLLVLGALDRNLNITALGKAMAIYPLDPLHAKAMITSLQVVFAHTFVAVPGLRQAQAPGGMVGAPGRILNAGPSMTVHTCSHSQMVSCKSVLLLLPSISIASSLGSIPLLPLNGNCRQHAQR